MSVAYETPTDWAAHYKAVRQRLLKTEQRTPAPVAVARRVRDIIYLKRIEPAVIYPLPLILPRLPENETSVQRARRILSQVAADYGYTDHDVKSARREKFLCMCRQEVCWRLKSELPWSLPHIGRFLGGRDHTSILHAVRKHQARLDAAKEMPTRTGHEPLTAAEHIARKTARAMASHLRRKEMRL